MNRKIGLFFGTFNPIHVGHLIIANHMAEYSDLDEVWMVVTPHNPHKKKSSLLDNHHRLEMVYKACEGYEKLKPSNIEFNLPQPNYTVNTLVHLQEKFHTNDFCLIMGEDNLKSLHKWKNYETILENHYIYVYPRIANGKMDPEFESNPKINRIDAPIVEISSTFIRRSIKESKNVRPLLNDEVWQYIDLMNFYK
ncbi:nicotinate (nicotinamide) nucleotide adenylyltransferase [Christiangramia salexigens]|uniref:Probable nicotinate-nucleotide adenylyltransferase n=1 Tax=Christiangramia salexigens TaxID=1913577 RepID=A0A1L3J6D9_9FLAO|nr:nicotinate (nicotinamide) nucleotide adenylyltransferase [Christiangramia salexigens]APG60695.1 nicotinic acid mononucleotide adenylyltransferase [Christiangramia salexigens]